MCKLKSTEKYNLNPNFCKNCNCKIEIKSNERVYDIKKKKFCSHSCAASFNNKGICRNPKKLNICECGSAKSKNSKICRQCYKNILLNKTLGEIINGKKYSTVLLASIRGMARTLLEESNIEKKCILCTHNEFNKVLETCHIKGIMSYSLESKIKEINDIKNLTWLCPSHHAMYDKGFIKVIGSAG